MALYRTEGVVLKTRNLGEADRIVTFYSPTKGKVRAVARGARRPRSRFVSSTQMFAHADFLVFSGKSLDNISQVEVKASFPRLHEDLGKLAFASYAAELLDAMVEEGEGSSDGGGCEEIFRLLVSYLGALSDTRDPEMLTRAFELKLSCLLGYKPVLEACAVCGEPDPGCDMGFDPGVGGIVCPRCLDRSASGVVRISRGSVEVLKKLLQLDFERVSRIGAGPGMRAEIERTMRTHLDFRLDRELKSLEFLDAVKAAPSGGGAVTAK
ncbi:MAG: DNA repair protein RecO [Firmicutes bacterium]|jgi:DNA repair protein RecO (recombination protein O)|nr:DNA repair protein RecO [Bacillota bacterium]MDH7496103.1 DNA repair protein RecO [Bacillota bacterium]